MTEWLKEKVSGRNLLVTVVAFIIFQVTFVLAVYVMVVIVGMPVVTNGFTLALLSSPSFLKLLLLGALVEELVLRVPLVVPVHYKWQMWAVYIFALASSLFYGGFYVGNVNVFLQASTSFFLCLQFLKCGSFQGNYFQAMMSCVVTNMALKLFGAGVLMFLLSQ